MLAGGKTRAWASFGFARRTDLRRNIEECVEELKEADLVLNFERDETMNEDFKKYAQVPAGGFRVDPGVEHRIKQFYCDRDIR